MDITSNKEIDKQILEFLYYESITLTVNYAEEYILNKNNEGKDNKNNKIRKRIDDINIVIKCKYFLYIYFFFLFRFC